jgi:SAM-dependent methyltransferase
MLNPYEKLSRIYDAGWGDFSIQYVSMVNGLLRERGLKQARVLDIACGTGILALELARCGHSVHGADISPEMIEIAKSKAVGVPNLSFDVRDMVELSSDKKYDVVTCTYDSINYLLRLRDVWRMLMSVISVLDSDGLLIFDSNTKYLYMKHADEVLKKEINGEEFIQRCEYRARGKVATTSFVFADGTYEVHWQRPYDYEELGPLLKRAGLRILHLFSWFEGLPYSPSSPKFFCVAQKG